MTDHIHEQLSAFLDGELSVAESELLLKRIERDPTLKATLERYVLAGEALRATQVQPRPSRDFGNRVSAAIERESLAGRARGYAAQWLKPVVGGAIAAGVAAVAIVNFQAAPTAAPASQEQAVNAVSASTVNTAPQGLGTSSSAQMVAADSNLTPTAGVPFGSRTANDSALMRYVVPPSSDRRNAPPIQFMNSGQLANYVVAHSEFSSPLNRRNVLTGLLAEDMSQAESTADVFGNSSISELAPASTNTNTSGGSGPAGNAPLDKPIEQRMLSRAPR
jgi:hypothetical protein